MALNANDFKNSFKRISYLRFGKYADRWFIKDDEIANPWVGTLKKENAVLSLAAGEEGFLGPFEVDAFNDVNGNITITCSAQTSIKLSALYL